MTPRLLISPWRRGQELAPRRTPFVQPQRLGGLRLRGLQEYRELDPIDTELAVVVLGIAANPATPT